MLQARGGNSLETSGLGNTETDGQRENPRDTADESLKHLRASVAVSRTREIDCILIRRDSVSLVLSCTHVVILKRMPKGEFGFVHGSATPESFDTGEAYECEACVPVSAAMMIPKKADR